MLSRLTSFFKLLPLFLIANTSFGQPGKVMDYSEREKMLNRVNNVTYTNEAVLEEIEAIIYPFSFEKIIVDTGPVAPPLPPPPKLTDAAVLKNFADTITPTGTLELMGRKLMTFRYQDGRLFEGVALIGKLGGSLEEGQVIPIRVQDEEKTIVVTKITRSIFVLRLNQEVFTKSTTKEITGGTISISNSTNERGPPSDSEAQSN